MKSNTKPQRETKILKVNSKIRAGKVCPASGLDVNVGFQYNPGCIAKCIQPKITDSCDMDDLTK